MVASGAGARASSNRLSPFRFVLGFGVVSLFGDATYEGARSISGLFLEHLGASALVVGVVTGGGEAACYVLRLLSGPAADSVRRRWPLTGWGYVANVVVVPLLALAHSVGIASALIVGERGAKAARVPARDTMIADAGSVIGHARAFSLHEAMDQTGAFLGPLAVALVLALGLGARQAFAYLAVPAACAIAMVAWVRARAPHPEAYPELALAHAPAGEGLERADRSGAAEPVHPTGRPVGPAAAKGWLNLPIRYWWYMGFAALTMFGYATWGVLSFHLAARHVIPAAQIPVLYAVAMGAGALVPLAGGWTYPRFGLRSLAVLPVLAAAVPFLSLATRPALVWIGALVWGGAQGLQESTMRTAVADLLPPERRGRGYGVFGSVYGLGWMGGGAIVGALYDVSIRSVDVFVVAVEIVALVAVLPLFRAPLPGRTPPLAVS